MVRGALTLSHAYEYSWEGNMVNSLLRVLLSVLILSAGAATAKTYHISGVLDPAGSPNGFRTSLFHNQKYGRMSGSMVDDPLNASGTWDSSTGALSFTMDLLGGGSVSVTGNLLVSNRGTSSAGYQGVYTSTPLKFAFSSASKFGSKIMKFSFADKWYNPEANGFGNGMISLWGDNGKYSWLGKNGCRIFSKACVGTDLRLSISAVPLPASIGFLLAGLGGLVGLRRFRRKALA